MGFFKVHFSPQWWFLIGGVVLSQWLYLALHLHEKVNSLILTFDNLLDMCG